MSFATNLCGSLLAFERFYSDDSVVTRPYRPPDKLSDACADGSEVNRDEKLFRGMEEGSKRKEEEHVPFRW